MLGTGKWCRGSVLVEVVGVSFEQLRSVGTGEIEIEKEEQSRHRIKKLQVNNESEKNI